MISHSDVDEVLESVILARLRETAFVHVLLVVIVTCVAAADAAVVEIAM
jgi:hypothetical protein